MSTSNKLATAALTGLLGLGFVGAGVAHAADGAATASTQQAKEKHACKGQNSCKGQGADGKNACKGQGSCATNK
jgi:hypothetical protein